MKAILVSKKFLDIEQYVEFKMSVLIYLSKSLISSRWVTNGDWHLCDWPQNNVQWVIGEKIYIPYDFS